MTAVIDQMITTGLSPSSTFLPHIYLQAAVANLAAILTLLRLDGRVEADDLALARHFYGLLLEMTIDIEGVEP